MELGVRIRALALESGLAGFGICEAAPFEDTGRDLEEAVASGRSGKLKFTFADPATSADPTRSFPWARRLLVGAHRYATDAGSPGPPAPGTGRVARFAEDDHYAPLRAALGAIAAMLRAEGHQAEVLVDDNRLVDRAAAVRAGVGWWGKSSMVLVPGAGPWVLLGSVVTDASLDLGSPMKRDCGTCDACIPACPTGAIVAPGILDARRCLAHWAQAPGSIPTEFREPMGDRVYGCDDCLEACPPGHRAIAGGAVGRGRVDLLTLLGTDDQTLRARYQRFYVPRNDVKYLRRNALVALGNTGGEDAVGVLAGFAAHRDPMLREHAAWALGRIGGARAAAALRAAADAGPVEEPRASVSVASSGV